MRAAMQSSREGYAETDSPPGILGNLVDSPLGSIDLFYSCLWNVTIPGLITRLCTAQQGEQCWQAIALWTAGSVCLLKTSRQ